ncbi:restriction endonuclease subunit S [Actinoallomurus spadix]|uniref:Restriction endonuclease subunit S n=1 Tax=Actinoallomurus spadix TaxID=79912 RepID=A0ABN0XBK8_9ACTN|nr:restriction endonuclease subunit S [Actinoallomurus spadix]MCO5987733.1 restriction endonuclease subunit S [Actinoallomurus spadix]
MSDLVKLGDYVELLTGFPFKSSGYCGANEPGIRLLRGDNIGQGRIRWEGVKFWPAGNHAAYLQYQLQVGDVVLAMDRPWIEAGLKYAEIRPEDMPSLLVQRVARLRALPGLNQKYLKYLIGSKPFIDYILGTQTGTAIPHISGRQIRDFEFALPSTHTQRAIGDILGTLDDKIAVNDRIATTYEKILRLEFEALKVDVEPELQDSIPASDVIEFNPRLRVSNSVDAVYLEMAALPTTTARVDDWARRPPKSGTRFMNGDTVMARITPCLENGKTAYIDFLEEGEVGIGSTEFIVMRTRAPYPTHLSYFLARSPRFRSHAIRNMVGSSGRQRVSAMSLTDFPLRRPHENDLARFGEATSKAFAHMKSIGLESKTLAELRDTLLPKLMSGGIRVRDAERLVEDAA